MVSPIKSNTTLLGLFALWTAISAAGCGSFQTAHTDMVATTGTDTSSINDPMIVVELHEGNGEREYLRAPLKDSMLVQDALKGSGAIHRFKRMEVVLVRQIPGRPKLRLPVSYDSSAKRVADENNYALHGGDVVEITENTSTTFDRMLEQALQPFKPMMRTYN